MSASATGVAASPAAAAAARVPASFFSIVLGLAGLGAAWRSAARAYGVSDWLADALLAVSAALFLGVLVAQVLRALRGDGLRSELEHPISGSLAALGPASLSLLAAGISVHYRDLALVLFWIAAAGQVAIGVWLAGRWLLASADPKVVTPALHLPAVGFLLAALAAGAVGRADAGWLLFGAGVFLWLVVAAALLGRHLSAGELPAAVRPLLALEIAAPAAALGAWQSLEGGAPDTVSRMLLGIALFQALVVARLLGRLRDVPFSPSYWAFAFPLSALAAGALRQSGAAPGSAAGALALPLFIVANAVVAAIAWQTVVAASRGKLLPPG
jgi:tellurite resistance protein